MRNTVTIEYDGKTYTYTVNKDEPRSEQLVSSIHYMPMGIHVRLVVFSRGGNAGYLTVNAEDAPATVARLLRTEERKVAPDTARKKVVEI